LKARQQLPYKLLNFNLIRAYSYASTIPMELGLDRSRKRVPKKIARTWHISLDSCNSARPGFGKDTGLACFVCGRGRSRVKVLSVSQERTGLRSGPEDSLGSQPFRFYVSGQFLQIWHNSAMSLSFSPPSSVRMLPEAARTATIVFPPTCSRIVTSPFLVSALISSSR